MNRLLFALQRARETDFVALTPIAATPMSPISAPPAVAPSAPRSRFVTALAWIVVVLGGVLTPISGISLLMLVAGSHGTASADATGILSVVVAPPVAVVAGIGLLGRQRWAWLAVLVLLGGVVAFNVRELATARRTTTTHISPTGVRTTMMASGPNYHSLPLIALALAAMARLLTRAVRAEVGGRAPVRVPPVPARPAPAAPPTLPASGPPSVAPDERGWRVGHVGRDRMYYEERHEGRWHRLEIDGEMLTGRAHHVIYFASPTRWQAYPEWARHRRDEIVGRIKSEFRPPDYEYDEPGEASVPSTAKAAAAVQPVAATHAPPLRPTATARQRATAWLAVALLGGIAIGLGWAVKSGVERGSTLLPMHRASFQRPITRQAEPSMYWFSLGLYATLGLAAGGAAAWLTRETLRLQRPRC